MKKWVMLIGLIVVVGALMTNMAMPISLADQNRIEIEGRLDEPSLDTESPSNIYDHYGLGNLYKGDKVRIVMTDLRGDGNVSVCLVNNISIFTTLSNFFHISGPSCPFGGLLLCLGNWANNFYETALLAQRLSLPGERSTVISNTDEEITLDVLSDGTWYIELHAVDGNVVYKGYMEVIKPEK